jgi:DNA phosphorothioation-associated putative methyltransferase
MEGTPKVDIMSPESTPVARHRTAISRYKMSRPIEQALADEVLRAGLTFFDYGSGRGKDVQFLRQAGFSAVGWDPAFNPSQAKTKADIVNLGFVLNVIEHPSERSAVLREAFTLARKALLVSAQIANVCKMVPGQPMGDGILTSRGTFQKYFLQDELRQFIQATLGVEPVPGGVGVFYVFADEAERQAILLRQVSRRRAPAIRNVLSIAEKLAPHRSLLEAFTNRILLLGRLPRPSEFEQMEELQNAIGSPKRAIKLSERLFKEFNFEAIKSSKRQDLLVYLALSRFQNRPRFGILPEPVQWDLRELFGSYNAACASGDELLFRVGREGAVDQACAESPLGKLLPQALYVHANLEVSLSPLLRVYLGCGRAFVGQIPEANILKIHRQSGKISYLSYPQFDSDPHPALARSTTVNLRTREIYSRDYGQSENPPILHRKEKFVDSSYPQAEKFGKLTKKEEAAGLLAPELDIGFLKQWNDLLASRSLRLVGHQLRRVT